MHPISDLTDMIGTPFSEMKCWDVVVEVYRRSGISLPEYTQIQMDEWREVREPMPGVFWCLLYMVKISIM